MRGPPSLVASVLENNIMKLSIKHVAAKAKTVPVTKAPVKTVKPAVAAKPTKAKVELVIALFFGLRGVNVRLVERHTSAEGVFIRATQDNDGKQIKDGSFAKIEQGFATGKRVALTELGCYVNGKLKGARVEFLTATQFAHRAGKALIKWAGQKDSLPGRYIGNPAKQGMLAVEVNGHYWQLELDSNKQNKHERGTIEPVTKNGKLVEVK